MSYLLFKLNKEMNYQDTFEKDEKVKKEYNVNSFISGGALFLSIFSSRRMLYVFQSFFGFHQRL